MWIAFEASLALAGKLAIVFPTEGYEPLLVSKKSGRLLTGAVIDKAWRSGRKGVIVQRQVGKSSKLPISRGEQLQLAS